MKTIIITGICLFLTGTYSYSQYNSCAGQSEVKERVQVTKTDSETGKKYIVEEVREVKNKDGHGNAQGNQYDLAVDGAFEGQTIVVLQLFGSHDYFDSPKVALKEKGFSLYRYEGAPPSPKELKIALDKACQFWLLSYTSNQLTKEHLEVIKNFFDSGKGVYIWGDNDPLNTEANLLSNYLVGAELSGDYYGDQKITFKEFDTQGGMKKDHLITTGLEYIYEGITISHVTDLNQQLTPLIYSSDGRVVTAVYERDGKRLIIDGGFTRLHSSKWNTAGTGRYVKNAAAWLVNYERFGKEVLSDNLK